jgi:FkbM family methyltransferase
VASDGDSNGFRRALFDQLARDLYRTRPLHADHERFGLGRRRRAEGRLRDAVAVTLDKLGIIRRPRRLDHVGERLAWLAQSLEPIEHVYDLFGDAASRALWLELVRFRTLGPRRVQLSRNSTAYRREYDSVAARFLRQRRSLEAFGWPLNLYEVPGREGPIRLHALHLFILNTFVLRQYEYEGAATALAAREGDVVIDGGAGWGDTALFLADAVGPTGRIHCFEFVPGNLTVLHENLRLNPKLAERISVHTAALWHTSGETIPYETRGPGSSLVRGTRDSAVETVTIDDFAASEAERVDFVKLDIEGAELEALDGAARTIARWKPRLAVAIYHSTEQFVGVPGRVAELEPSYRLFLAHFTTHSEETVLYASAG